MQRCDAGLMSQPTNVTSKAESSPLSPPSSPFLQKYCIPAGRAGWLPYLLLGGTYSEYIDD